MEFQKETLSNGVRILTAPLHETKAMTLLLLVGTGSRFETPRQNGISHFLEHILFKGTEKYPGPQILAEVLDGIGANFNAYTSEEYTGFYVNAAAEHFPLALDVLHQMFYHPRYAHEDIEREKGVIDEEINMYRDLPQRHVFDLLKSLMYGQTPMGRNVAGEHETVNAFGKTDFEDYQRSWYTPDNLIVSMAGNPLKHHWTNELTELFGSKTGTKAGVFDPLKYQQSDPRVNIQFKATDQTHIALAIPTIQETDPLMPVQSVLHTILGGSMSSRLFNEVREQRGLAYYVRSSQDSYHDVGSLIISAGVRNASAKEAIEVILTQLSKLVAERVTAKELVKAKENFRGSLALQLEESSEIATYLASQELYHRQQFQPEELVAKIQAVTAGQVQDFAHTYIQKELLNLAAVGPFKESDFQPLLEKAL
ncbi:insulinase family protein [Candidatus Berkelbacteria bacterium]|nr:insulinase family protein [Candidatus Berkelbacteria bacterium]